MLRKKQTAEDTAREECRVWFRAVMHRLLAYARIQADSEADVELLLSGVMTRVVEAVVQGRVPMLESELMPYCMSAIRHEAMRQRRRNLNRREAETQFCAQTDSTAHVEHPRMSEADAAARTDQLRRALRQLPPEQSDLVVLHLWEDVSFAEMARRTATPESTLRSRYLVALRSVKSFLSSSDFEL